MDRSTIPFSVRRHEAEMVVPAKSTPHELKQLSDIDDHEGLRFQLPVMMVYRRSASMEGRDPARVTREALARALVFYYPLAGRLVEGPNRKLSVDCRGQGVLFVEADADVELDVLVKADAIRPPCPFLEELLHDVQGSGGILGCPLLLIQVTRFICGGFILALRVNHTMCDASGLFQFLDAMAEFARGAVQTPSVPPVWQRQLLSARNPPRITCQHREYDDVVDTNNSMDDDGMVRRSFFFGHEEFAAIRQHLPPHLRGNCTKFEVLTACLWRCRTAALNLEKQETVRMSCIGNARGRKGLAIPAGYYGNVLACPAAVCEAATLCERPFGYAVELIKAAKAQVTEEYIRSVADLMVIKGRPLYTTVNNFIVSDNTRIGFDKVDFGWGRPTFGGPAGCTPLASFYVPFKSSGREEGTVVAVCLPSSVMESFQQELQKMINAEASYDNDIKPIKFMPSP